MESSVTISITDFGAVGDGKTDNRAALQKAFDQARATGQDVYIPPGVYCHSGVLTITGIHVAGAGEASVLKATSYGQEVVWLKGDGVALSDVRLDGVGGSRLTSYTGAKVAVQDATNFSIENIHIGSSSAAGIIMNNSSYGHIAGNIVENTRADSIHMVNGAHDLVVEQNRVERSGDDGISVVTYGNAGMVNHITVRDNEVLDSVGGRGLTVVGGSDVTIEHNTVKSSAGNAGVYIACEGSYSTQAAHNVRVSGNTVIDAGGLTSGHGAITIYNSRAGYVNDDITLADNDIVNPRKMGILVVGSAEQHLAAYGNTITGSSYGSLVILGSNATVSTTRPASDIKRRGASPLTEAPE